VPLERTAQHASVLGERISVLLRAELLEKPGRSLDVREEKGDGAARQLGHGASLRRRGPP
jgi:hypothetical protein